jgi:hypothetical protein
MLNTGDLGNSVDIFLWNRLGISVGVSRFLFGYDWFPLGILDKPTPTVVDTGADWVRIGF